MKFRLFEFEDLSWFPATIRAGMTDYLRFIFNITSLYKPIVPVLHEVLTKTGSNTIIDLCSGAGGPVEEVIGEYKSRYNIAPDVYLTDKFPNAGAFENSKKHISNIRYIDYPVDAMDVPETLKGTRTIFSGFHHFNRDEASRVIGNAIDANEAIAIYDGGDKNMRVLFAILMHPVIMFFCTPFIRPFRLSRILFTYIIPLIPFCTVWDGWVSILRLYTPGQMQHIAQNVSNGRYTWKSGRIKTRFGMNIAFLTGIPEKT